MIWNLDIHYSRGYYNFNNIALKDQIQKINIKNFCFKKPKAKKTKLDFIKGAKLLKQKTRKKRLENIDRIILKNIKIKSQPLAITLLIFSKNFNFS